MKNLDVLLINPGNTISVYQQLSIEFSAIEPPIFCGLFANYLRKKGCSVKILDVPAQNLTPAQVANAVKEFKPKLIAMVVYGFQPSASTQSMHSASEICKEIKASNPESKILITGTHPAALPERTLREEAVDFVCTREGPLTIWGLAETLKTSGTDFSKVPSLCYFDNNQVRFTKNAELIKELDQEMPGIAWDLLPMEKYRAHNWHCFDDIDRRMPYASIHTSLGCPYKCSFCCINTPFSGPNYSMIAPTYRMWSPKNVVNEIGFLVEKYGIRNIKIADEMFVLNPTHVLSVCDKLIERDYDLNIWAYTRIDTVRDEFLAKLRKAGFRWLAIGIESGSKYVRDSSNKKFKNDGKNLLKVNENVIEVVREIQNAGIYTICNYIFGMPDDTMETMKETLDLSLEINSEFANFYSAMAYPGSPLYELAKQKKLPLPDDPGGPGWIGYAQHAYETLPLLTDNVSAENVLKFRDDAFLKYFTDPEYLNLVKVKFGNKAVEHIQEMTSVPRLKRKILGD